MEDKDLQAQIEVAKAAGYTDDEIQAHLDELHGTAKPLEAPEQNKHHEANVGTAQMAGLAGAEKIGEVGKKVLEYGLPAAGVGYGLYKGGQAMANRPVAPTNVNVNMPGQPMTQAEADFAKMDAFGRGQAPNVPGEAPYTPGSASGASAEAQAYQKAAQEAAARQAAAQPPTAANFMQRVAALAGRYAPMARVGTGIGLALYPSSTGPQVPTAGPARGAEINPATGRPWTQFELDRYNQQY